MISFNYETEFKLEDQKKTSDWIMAAIDSENCQLGEINYVFCDDDYLHKINVEYLNHDTLTDIISFDFSVGKKLQGDIFISIDRVRDNAKDFSTVFEEELHRVIIHGILHYCGYGDKSEADLKEMRAKEDHYLKSRK